MPMTDDELRSGAKMLLDAVAQVKKAHPHCDLLDLTVMLLSILQAAAWGGPSEYTTQRQKIIVQVLQCFIDSGLEQPTVH